jgi:hypothetical protein
MPVPLLRRLKKKKLQKLWFVTSTSNLPSEPTVAVLQETLPVLGLTARTSVMADAAAPSLPAEIEESAVDASVPFTVNPEEEELELEPQDVKFIAISKTVANKIVFI